MENIKNATTEKTDLEKKKEELLKEFVEEQMRLHPEIYEKPQKETES